MFIIAGQFRARVSLLLMLLLALPIVTATAQVTTADVVGRVTDGSEAVLAKAKVVIENIGTRDKRTMETDESGEFVFNLLPIGRYSVRIEATGFKAFSVPELVLAGGDRRRIEAQLQLGEIAEAVAVKGAAIAVQTDSSTFSALVTGKAVQDLPLNGRNFIRLAQLVPGANPGPPTALSSGERPDDRRRTSTVSVAGQRDIVNNYLIDGMDNNDRVIGTVIVKPSIDAIAEFRVQTNLYTAEVGRTAGGVINLITKSGTNEYHGSAFEFFRDEKLGARDFFAPPGPKPKSRLNQFGGSIGGPIFKDKTFFFGDYEQFREQLGQVFTVTVPTARMRNGDFSELLTQGVRIYDPFTNPRTPFAGNIIPQNRISSIGARYAALYPEPNRAGLANNFSSAPTRTQNDHTFDVRIDHLVKEQHVFFTRYSFNDTTTFTPGALPAVDGVEPNGVPLSFSGPALQRAQGLHFNYVHTFRPTLLLELKAGYSRYAVQSLPLNYGANVSADFGLVGVNFDETTSGLAQVGSAGFATLGDSPFIPLIQFDNNFEYGGILTYARRAHNIKAGTSIKRRQFTIFQSTNPRGNYAFNTAQTNNGAGAGGHSIASLLLGTPSQVQRANSLVWPGYRTSEPGFFVQDDWRATRWLTVNLGVRYDIFTPFTEVGDRISNVDLSTGKILVAGQNASRTTNIKTNYTNIAPRLGFAATIGRGTVVRGGYGMNFFPGNYSSSAALKNQPFNATFQAVNSTTGVPAFLLSTPLPLPAAPDANKPSGTITAVAIDFQPTCVHQYNVTVQREFGGNLVSAAYVGALGRHEMRIIPNINRPLPGPGPIQPRRPFVGLLPNVTGISYMDSGGSSSYHAMQLSLERRYKAGLTLSTNYTWAHGIDNVELIGGSKPTGSAYGALINNLGSNERGSGDLDIRHRWVLMANYEIPFGNSMKGLQRRLIQGWQINAIAYWQSGLPFTVTNGTSRSNTGGGDRPNRIAEGTTLNPSLAMWFDTKAFVPQNVNTAGNSGRNILQGPSRRSLDMSLFKDFTITETERFQFRVETFNLTNTPNFSLPNAALGNPGFGTITNTLTGTTPRQIQVALKYLF